MVVRQAGSSNLEYFHALPWSNSSARMKEDGRVQELEQYASSLSQAERQREQDVGLGSQVWYEARYRRVSCCLTRVEGCPWHSTLTSPSKPCEVERGMRLSDPLGEISRMEFVTTGMDTGAQCKQAARIFTAAMRHALKMYLFLCREWKESAASALFRAGKEALQLRSAF